MRLNRTRKFEKTIDNSKSMFKVIKTIHDGLKDAARPVDIEYDGPSADVLLKDGKDTVKIATIVLEPNPESGINSIKIFRNGKSVKAADSDEAVDKLAKIYDIYNQ